MNYNKIWMDLIDIECYITDYLFCEELDMQIFWDGEMLYSDPLDERIAITFEEFKDYLIKYKWLVFSQTPLEIMYTQNID